MTGFARILVPVDLTEKNHEAIRVAAHLVQDDGEVQLLHVIEEIEAPFEEMREFYDRLEERARTALAEFTNPLQLEGVPHTTHICYGRRAREIIRHASEQAFDLVILSSHRLDPADLSRTLMTISHQVALASDRPILLLR